MHWWQAHGPAGHGIHSPFVFDFATQVLRDRKSYAAYAPIEERRRKLAKSNDRVPVEDYGSGGRQRQAAELAVADVCARAARSPRWRQLLFRIARHYRPRSIVELGTSLGLSTAYLASAAPDARVVSMEGNRALATIARENMQQLGLTNVNIVSGNFDDTLASVLSDFDTIDLAFVDGNHRKAPTLDYFFRLMERRSDTPVFVFDDIHWSAGMEEAWRIICGHPDVQLSIDLFHFGLIFFRPEFKVKQHFLLRY